MGKYSVILKESDKLIGTYRLEEDMFLSIKEQITPFRTHAVPSKPVRCVETGVIFKNARKAAKWLYDIEATSSVSADAAVKLACKGKRNIAHGYHWEYADSN